jgi:hypothetical protein
MKDALLRMASAVVAAVIVYVALTMFAERWGLGLRLIVAAVVGLVALAVAIWAAKGSTQENAPPTKLASNLRGESALIEDVQATTSADHTAEVASDIRTKGPIEIKRASIDQSDKAK